MKENIVQRILWIFLILFCGVNLYTQSTILNKYIAEGIENNLSLKNADLDINIQNSVISQAKKLWSPKVDVNGSYLLATGGRTIVFPVGDLFNPAYATLNQLTGTEQFPTDLENFESQLTPNYFLDLQMNIGKPLINSSIKYNQKIQEELLFAKALDKEITQNEIIFQIKSAYYNYLKTFKGIATLDDGIHTLNQLLNFNQVLLKNHKVTSDAISDVDYRIAALKSQKISIEEQQHLSMSLFNLLINRPLGSKIEIDNTITNAYSPIEKNLESLKITAIQNRSELQQINHGEKINDLNQSRIKKEGSPNLNAFGGLGVQTEKFNFDNGGPLYTAGLNMTMNITDGGFRKKKVEQLKFEKEKLNTNRAMAIQQIEIKITQIYYQLKSIESLIGAAISAEQSAQKSFDILKVKYENDRVLLIELLQAQNRLTSSQLNLDLLKYDHLTKMAELEKAMENGEQ